MKLIRRLRLALRDTTSSRLDEQGFTLLEALISIGILTLVASVFAYSTFQVLNTERRWRPSTIAVRELRQAGSYVAGDVLNASTTTLANLTPSTSATFLWEDTNSTEYVVTYALDDTGTILLREINGQVLELAQDVVSVEFNRSNRLITFYLEVESGVGTTKWRTLRTYMRTLR